MARVRKRGNYVCCRCKGAPTPNGLPGYCRVCRTDYARELRRRQGAQPRRPIEELFWEKVDKGGPAVRTDLGPCWVWLAYLNENGYGQFGRRGLAHRFSWRLTRGEIPLRHWVLHKCDNRRCVNPAHLFLGDRQANTVDMLSKCRQARGPRNAAAKLTEDDVREIRRLREGGLSLRKIAARFGVNDMNVHYICKRITWAHV